MVKINADLPLKIGTKQCRLSVQILPTSLIHFSNVNTPSEYTLHEALTGKRVKEIQDNKALLSKLDAYEISPKEFSSIAINGNELNMWMIKPADFDASKKYPLFMYQYTGPGSQSGCKLLDGV